MRWGGDTNAVAHTVQRVRSLSLLHACREVEPQSYGLSAREILRLEDRELNQIVGLKKLAPYREDGGRVGGKALRYKLQQFGVGGEGRGEVGGRGTGGEGRGRGRGRAGGGAGRGTHGASDGGQGQGQGQGSSRRETYERPLLVKRGEKVEDAKVRGERELLHKTAHPQHRMPVRKPLPVLAVSERFVAGNCKTLV